MHALPPGNSVAMADRSSSRSVFRPLRDKFVNAWHNHVSRKHHRSHHDSHHTHTNTFTLPPVFEEEFRVPSLPQQGETWRGDVFNENVYEPAFETSSSMVYPSAYPYSGTYPPQRPAPNFKFTTSDTIFDSAYFLSNDIETIATILEQVFANNLTFLLDNPYWNYGTCPPLLGRLDLTSKPIFSQLKGEPIVTLGYRFPTFTDLLLSLQSDNTIQKVLCEQKKKGENLRFLQAFKFNDEQQSIKHDIVPVVIVGIFCVEVPVMSPYKPVPLDNTSKRTINFAGRNHIFHEFNAELSRVEKELSRSMKKYPLFNQFKSYRGPRFSMRPLIFTNLSEYGWQLVQLTHVFQFQDPILNALPQMLTQMYNYLSNPVEQYESSPNSTAPTFQPPRIEPLIRETSEHYLTPNMDLYLKQRPWGRPSLVKFPNSNSKYWCGDNERHIDTHYFTEITSGEECSICLLEYKESEICLHLNCTHVFHKSCIEQWMYSSSSSRCPLCRRMNKKFGLY